MAARRVARAIAAAATLIAGCAMTRMPAEEQIPFRGYGNPSFTTPGAYLSLAEVSRARDGQATRVDYRVVVRGLTRQASYELWLIRPSRFGSTEVYSRHVIRGVTIADDGVVVDASGRPALATAHGFLRGEPLMVVVWSPAGGNQAAREIHPFPIAAEGQACRIEGRPNYNVYYFRFWGEQLQPGRRLVFDLRSPDGNQHIEAEVAADGSVAASFRHGGSPDWQAKVVPTLPLAERLVHAYCVRDAGRTDPCPVGTGEALLTVTGSGCDVSLRYLWGTEARTIQ